MFKHHSAEESLHKPLSKSTEEMRVEKVISIQKAWEAEQRKKYNLMKYIETVKWSEN